MLEVHWLGQVHVSARADALLEHFGLHTPRNHFKRVNDTHGHLVGDRVIQALGEIMRTSVTNPLHAIARYGGEEFAILAPQTSLEQSIQVAATIRRRARAMKFRHRNMTELQLSVSVSVGIARMRPGDDAISLISRSDSALYRSKADGRDRLTCAKQADEVRRRGRQDILPAAPAAGRSARDAAADVALEVTDEFGLVADQLLHHVAH
jgi:diguanylate cyclase (GGDEF)-like protein